MAACLIALAIATTTRAQTLAHPGWNGNGLNVDPWWSHAIFYDVRAFDPATPNFKVIANRLDHLQALGVDAILVPPPRPAPSPAAPNPNLDDFDDLIHRASRDGIRILIDLPAVSATPDVLNTARFLSTHGVAGFRILTPSGTGPFATQAIVQALRRITDPAAGQRIILADLPIEAAANSFSIVPDRVLRQSARRAVSAPSPDQAQLQIDTRLNRLLPSGAEAVRPALAQSVTQPNSLIDLYAQPDAGVNALDRVLAAIALTIHPAALIDAGAKLVIPQDSDEPVVPPPVPTVAPAAPAPPAAALPPGTYAPYVPYVAPARKPAAAPGAPQPSAADPLTDWYRRLAILHHGNPVLRYGSVVPIDFDRQNALVWLVRPASPSNLTPPVVVLCNLSGETIQLALGDEMKKAGLRGNFLHTLLRSDNGMGGQDLNAVTLPPYGVYIGELRR